MHKYTKRKSNYLFTQCRMCLLTTRLSYDVVRTSYTLSLFFNDAIYHLKVPHDQYHPHLTKTKRNQHTCKQRKKIYANIFFFTKEVLRRVDKANFHETYTRQTTRVCYIRDGITDRNKNRFHHLTRNYFFSTFRCELIKCL
jgi:hypothetical protein